MQWEAGKRNGGFTTAEPWLPVGAETAVVNVESQRGDAQSMLELYRRLIRLRRSSPALRRGSYRPVDGAPDDVFAWWREADGERWLVACNFGGSPARLVVDRALGGPGDLRLTLRVSSNPGRAVDLAVGGVIDLSPEEGIVADVAGPAADRFEN
jgi:alpha-glucosidase